MTTSTDPARRKKRFAVLLPLLWGVGCVVGYLHPGDEYGLYGLGSIVGVWILMFGYTTIHSLALPLLAGCAVMLGLGQVLDVLRGKRALLLVIWPVAAAALCSWQLSTFESIESAIAKNGSLLAYIAMSSQLGLYLAVVATIAAAGVSAWWRMFSADLADQRRDQHKHT